MSLRFPDQLQEFGAVIDSGSYHSHLDISIATNLNISMFPLDEPVQISGFDGANAGVSTHWAPWDFDIGSAQIKGGKWLISSITGEN